MLLLPFTLLLLHCRHYNEKDYQSVLWESAGFMQVKVGA